MKFLILPLAALVWAAGCSFPTSNTASSSGTTSTIVSPTTPITNSLSATLPASVANGVILDAWQWSFAEIQANLGNIADAGYSAVQVSPVQPTKSNLSISNGFSWYLFYQPCDLTVGNAQLGTETAFQNLCSAASSKGIKIIVDAVLNQVADDGTDGGLDSHVNSTFATNKSTYFHNKGTVSGIGGWQNRYAMTQGNLGNGADWNTQNSTVQTLHKAFLNQCVADGAGGFRIDAAKSIETSVGLDASQSWAGSWWASMQSGVTNWNTLFNYGEVLQDTNDNEAGYQQFVRTTASNFISTLSQALDNKNLTGLGTLYRADGGAEDPTKIVVYLENWDNYEGSVGTNTSGFSYNKRLLANAILTARAGMVNIVFARPSEGLWWDPVMVAVNRFRNAMENAGATSEWLAYQGNALTTGNSSNSVLAIRRKNSGTDKGVVLVNAGAATTINLTLSGVADGTYSDFGPSGKTYTVSSGTLTGTMPANTAVVLVF